MTYIKHTENQHFHRRLLTQSEQEGKCMTYICQVTRNSKKMLYVCWMFRQATVCVITLPIST